MPTQVGITDATCREGKQANLETRRGKFRWHCNSSLGGIRRYLRLKELPYQTYLQLNSLKPGRTQSSPAPVTTGIELDLDAEKELPTQFMPDLPLFWGPIPEELWQHEPT